MCPQCGTEPKEWRGDICYRCHVKSLKWGGLVTLASDRDHNHTQRELQHQTIKQAAKDGREIQRVGERWI
jgi:hypothetical protein